jgi:hypothetical protein
VLRCCVDADVSLVALGDDVAEPASPTLIVVCTCRPDVAERLLTPKESSRVLEAAAAAVATAGPWVAPRLSNGRSTAMQ